MRRSISIQLFTLTVRLERPSFHYPVNSYNYSRIVPDTRLRGYYVNVIFKNMLVLCCRAPVWNWLAAMISFTHTKSIHCLFIHLCNYISSALSVLHIVTIYMEVFFWIQLHMLLTLVLNNTQPIMHPSQPALERVAASSRDYPPCFLASYYDYI